MHIFLKKQMLSDVLFTWHVLYLLFMVLVFICLFVLILHLAVYHLKTISTIIIFSFSVNKIN